MSVFIIQPVPLLCYVPKITKFQEQNFQFFSDTLDKRFNINYIWSFRIFETYTGPETVVYFKRNLFFCSVKKKKKAPVLMCLTELTGTLHLESGTP